MSLTTAVQRLVATPPRNVGGGDLVTRMLAVLALLAMIALIALIAPQAATSYPLIKICLLVLAEFGLISLMLGLFLGSKTYFAGVQLFAASLSMLWLTTRTQPWLAIIIGLGFVAAGAMTVVTRRSRLNALLDLNSLGVPLEEVEAAEAVASADPSLKPLTNGGSR